MSAIHQFGRRKLHVDFSWRQGDPLLGEGGIPFFLIKYRAVRQHSSLMQHHINLPFTLRKKKMHFYLLSVALLPLTTRATNVVLSNDDGWAEINIRTLYNTLTAAGDSVVLSAPAENESGTGV